MEELLDDRGVDEAMRSDRGTTLIETVIALGILLVAMAGLLSMAVIATSLTENQGRLGARTTEYAQDKLEQLLALSYADVASNTAVFPAATSGGTGLAIGGSSSPAAPAAGYVDWIDAGGTLLTSSGATAPAGWFYERVWAVTNPSTNLKQITVTVIVASSVGGAQIPQSTVTALKTFPF